MAGNKCYERQWKWKFFHDKEGKTAIGRNRKWKNNFEKFCDLAHMIMGWNWKTAYVKKYRLPKITELFWLCWIYSARFITRKYLSYLSTKSHLQLPDVRKIIRPIVTRSRWGGGVPFVTHEHAQRMEIAHLPVMINRHVYKLDGSVSGSIRRRTN